MSQRDRRKRTTAKPQAEHAVKQTAENGGDGRDTQGRFAEGGPGGPGRPPGVLNKTGAMLRQAFLNTFEQLGGERWLTKQARKDPRTFIRTVSRMLPREATIHKDAAITIRHPDFSPERQAEIEAEQAERGEIIRKAAQAAGLSTHPASLLILCSQAARYFCNLPGNGENTADRKTVP
jgi:hypothetical protein